MGKVGRKSKYYTHVEPYITQIRMWRQNGETEYTIAKTLGVAQSTWCTYKLKFPEFKEALKEERDFILAKTEQSLYQSAWGTREQNFKEIWVPQYNIKTQSKEMVLVKREVYPDKVIEGKVSAQIFALKNLDPNKWQDRRIIDQIITEDDKITIINDAPGDKHEDN